MQAIAVRDHSGLSYEYKLESGPNMIDALKDYLKRKNKKDPIDIVMTVNINEMAEDFSNVVGYKIMLNHELNEFNTIYFKKTNCPTQPLLTVRYAFWAYLTNHKWPPCENFYDDEPINLQKIGWWDDFDQTPENEVEDYSNNRPENLIVLHYPWNPAGERDDTYSFAYNKFGLYQSLRSRSQKKDPSKNIIYPDGVWDTIVKSLKCNQPFMDIYVMNCKTTNTSTQQRARSPEPARTQQRTRTPEPARTQQRTRVRAAPRVSPITTDSIMAKINSGLLDFNTPELEYINRVFRDNDARQPDQNEIVDWVKNLVTENNVDIFVTFMCKLRPSHTIKLVLNGTIVFIQQVLEQRSQWESCSDEDWSSIIVTKLKSSNIEYDKFKEVVQNISWLTITLNNIKDIAKEQQVEKFEYLFKQKYQNDTENGLLLIKWAMHHFYANQHKLVDKIINVIIKYIPRLSDDILIELVKSSLNIGFNGLFALLQYGVPINNSYLNNIPSNKDKLRWILQYGIAPIDNQGNRLSERGSYQGILEYFGLANDINQAQLDTANIITSIDRSHAESTFKSRLKKGTYCNVFIGDKTLLMHLAEKNYNLNDLLDNIPFNVNQQTEAGGTALMFAAAKGNHITMQNIIKHSAILNTQDITGNTALHYAIAYQHVQAAKVLVENGANLDLTNNQNLTPRQYITTDVMRQELA